MAPATGGERTLFRYIGRRDAVQLSVPRVPVRDSRDSALARRINEAEGDPVMNDLLRPALLAAALAVPAAALAQPEPSAADDRAQAGAPLLVARGDGSWTITRAIHAAPVSLAATTDGLVLLGGEQLPPSLLDWQPDDAREAMREAELEAAERRAWEEALDQARQAELTPQQ